MIAFLNGVLVEKHPARIVVDVSGVGYDVFISLGCFDALPSTGQAVRILTCHHVREDAQILFGFLTEAERAMFGLLIGVSGVGPKVALGVLSGLSAPELRAAIAEGDIARLTRLHGVGRKTAERVVMELRDRIDPLEAFAAEDPGPHGRESNALVRDALMALAALGFSEDQARKMVKKILAGGPPPEDAETLVRMALAGR